MDGERQIRDGSTSRPAIPVFENLATGSGLGSSESQISKDEMGWPAGWPITYLASPIHFVGILLVLVYYWITFPY